MNRTYLTGFIIASVCALVCITVALHHALHGGNDWLSMAAPGGLICVCVAFECLNRA